MSNTASRTVASNTAENFIAPILGLLQLPFWLFWEIYHYVSTSQNQSDSVAAPPFRKRVASGLALLYSLTQGFVMFVLFKGVLGSILPGSTDLIATLTASIFSASSFWVNYHLANKSIQSLIDSKGENSDANGEVSKKQKLLFGFLGFAAVCAAVLTAALIWSAVSGMPLGVDPLPVLAAFATFLVSCVLYVKAAWNVSKSWDGTISLNWTKCRDFFKNNMITIVLGLLVVTGLALTSFSGAFSLHDLLVKWNLESAGQYPLSIVAAVLCFVGELAFALKSIEQLGKYLQTAWQNFNLIPDTKEGKFDRLLLISKVVVVTLSITGVISTSGIAPLVLFAVYMAIPLVKSLLKRITSDDQPVANQIHSEVANALMPSPAVGCVAKKSEFRPAAANGVANGCLAAYGFKTAASVLGSAVNPLFMCVLVFGAVQSFALTAQPEISDGSDDRGVSPLEISDWPDGCGASPTESPTYGGF
jgi:hypothetical protein